MKNDRQEHLQITATSFYESKKLVETIEEARTKLDKHKADIELGRDILNSENSRAHLDLFMAEVICGVSDLLQDISKYEIAETEFIKYAAKQFEGVAASGKVIKEL